MQSSNKQQEKRAFLSDQCKEIEENNRRGKNRDLFKKMFKLDLEKVEEPDIKLPAFIGSLEKQQNTRKTSISALLTKPKPLIVWITTNWKILKEMGIPDHLACLLRNLYAGQEASQNWTWNNRLFPNWERSMSRLYIVTLII